MAGITEWLFTRGTATAQRGFAARGHILSILTLDTNLPLDHIHGIGSAGYCHRPARADKVFIAIILKSRPIIEINFLMAAVTERDFFGKATPA